MQTLLRTMRESEGEIKAQTRPMEDSCVIPLPSNSRSEKAGSLSKAKPELEALSWGVRSERLRRYLTA